MTNRISSANLKVFTTTRRPRNKLLIFARVPEEGQVKTRLEPHLGRCRTLALYAAMLADLFDSIGGPTLEMEVEVLWTSSGDVSGSDLRGWFGEYPLSMQTGSSLGERLVLAFTERILFHQAQKIIVIGTDDPALPRELIEHAFASLDSCEWILGPAVDGGYYMIGCRAEAFRPEVFERIEWGTSSVLPETRRRIRQLGATLAMFPERFDIDRMEDLDSFQRMSRTGRVGRILQEWGIAS